MRRFPAGGGSRLYSDYVLAWINENVSLNN